MIIIHLMLNLDTLKVYTIYLFVNQISNKLYLLKKASKTLTAGKTLKALTSVLPSKNDIFDLRIIKES